MNKVRWFLFIPGGLLAAFVAGFLVLAITMYTIGEGRLGWTLVGLLSSAAYFWASFAIAPHVTNLVKWLVLILQVIVGVLYIAGPLLGGTDTTPMAAGFAMLLLAVMLSRVPADQFNNKETDV